jgi:hypothetical protein
MASSQREQWTDANIVALVELDTEPIRMRIFLARGAITARLQELAHGENHHGEKAAVKGARASDSL